MTVEELSGLHGRYVDLSQRFRAAWVYHQFLQSLHKVAGGETRSVALTQRFQNLYAELKECSHTLSAAEPAALRTRFDRIGAEVERLLAAMLAEDSKIPPSRLRQFFQKFRRYDEKILAQLLRFYLVAQPPGEWDADRRDKVDFLVTRLGEEDRGVPGAGIERQRLREIFSGLWALTGEPVPAPEKLTALRRPLVEIRRELAGVESLDELADRESLATYRDFKRDLGALFFEPDILLEILETNLAFRDRVESLYAREERDVVADYQRIFDLEREVVVDVQLDQELSRFREQVERFEGRLRQDEVRLDELAQLRRRARSLIPRLSGRTGGPAAAWNDPEAERAAGRGTGAEEEADESPDPADASAARDTVPRPAPQQGARPAAPPPEPGPAEPLPALLEDPHRRLLDALGSTTLGTPAHAVVHTADLFPFRLEPREVLAFRRLLGDRSTGAGEASAERFLLAAAALRVALEEEADRVRSLVNAGGEGAGRARRRGLLALGDDYLRRYEHHQHTAVVDGRVDDARVLVRLRVRLMQEYASLWLAADPPG
ncbi:MAG TPA: hypothetical protein VHQ65_16765 [Thermoanaerobaculia bacterium]|nr:hypothetical protein [Thermoanaerobaculia bacterium]